VRIKVGVAYGTDVDQVEKVLLKAAHDNPLVSPKPEPRVRFRTFGDSSLDFELLCWAHRPHDKGKIIHELNREIYKQFDREGIVIPFPQRDVYVHSQSE
jgi:MscS family membrane protein